MVLFIVATVVFSLAVSAFMISLFVFMFTKRFKRTFMALGIFSAVSFVVFLVGLFGFIGSAGSAGGMRGRSSGMFVISSDSLREGVWSFNARSANGSTSRNPNFTTEHMRSIQMSSQIDSGEVWLEFLQDGTQVVVELANGLAQTVDLTEFGLVPGSVQVTLRFADARDVRIQVDWGN